MPIFEYHCRDCGRRFPLLEGVVAEEAKTECPHCGSTDIVRLISKFAVSRSDDSDLDADDDWDEDAEDSDEETELDDDFAHEEEDQ